ncbi:G-box-binding factor 1 [Impatiens glandulifera]|uniref:G-box-binding factor 1 n=1 Tax=Impatiens glandulifera TaxID=253017 RepID=UPI001FB0F3EF|nr:G-box-binding factor 1 [Impatiens glandulifera]XP_047323534.1 G-box-binding factor 1 [Impatiens glandulifera]
MRTGEDNKTEKPVKATSSTQETPTAPSYPDWSMQSYYGAAAGAPPPFFATTVASPATHPYLWGGQHAMIPPYGTPVPYPALYPHGGSYPHPSTAQIPSMQQTIAAMESRAAAEGKDPTTIKKAKGTSGATLVGSSSKAGEIENTTSGDDGVTESAESGSEESSDSNDNNLQEEKETTINKKGSFHPMLVEGAQSDYNHASAVASVPPNLSKGINFWSASAVAGSGAVKGRPNPPILALPAIAPSPRGRMMASDRAQDDRELKRQKRKQSNRESARRSRLRKQIECEELQAKVEALTSENEILKDELGRLSKECQRIASENNSMKADLIKVRGPDANSKLEISHNAEPRSDEENN